MKLRIIGGTLRGRIICLSGVAEEFRPTMDRMREAVASSLQKTIPDALVADVCAGSGAFGFEMLSRGAARVDFVEDNRLRAEAIRARAREFGVEDRCRIVCQSVQTFVRHPQPLYDIIYYDPPYESGELYSYVKDLYKMLRPHATLLVERGRRDIQTDPAQPRPHDRRWRANAAHQTFDLRVFAAFPDEDDQQQRNHDGQRNRHQAGQP